MSGIRHFQNMTLAWGIPMEAAEGDGKTKNLK
jgi:hypothetical protein